MTFDELAERLVSAQCDECEQYITPVVPLTLGGSKLQVEAGLVLDITGGYGMFNDGMFEDDYPQLIVLCHDCVVKVFRAIPNAAMRYAGSAMHECPEEVCDWGRAK